MEKHDYILFTSNGPYASLSGGLDSGTVAINNTLKVDGRDILSELDDIHSVLNMIKRDLDMESKYPELKKIKDEYTQKLEMYKTFDILNGTQGK